MIFHHNYGVSEHSDELDAVLLDTVARLKAPGNIPAELYTAPQGSIHMNNMSEYSEDEGYSSE
jgi:hypothetical protein